MSTVASHAIPAPVRMTPSVHTCAVSRGSRPIVLSKTQAARTEMANWNQATQGFYAVAGLVV